MTLEILPDLLDNKANRTVSDALNHIVGPNTQVHIATCFFNVGGYSLVHTALQKAKTVRILLGKEPGAANLAAGLAPTQQITEALHDDLYAALKPGERRAVDELKNFVAFLQRQEVEFRLYHERFFHAKAYILENVPHHGWVGMVGSSNFTAAGLTGNTELNLVNKQKAVVEELLAWFNTFWERAQDYKADLLATLTQAVSLYPPYLVYMKSLYASLHDRLGLDLPFPDETTSDKAPQLADFQLKGYEAARDILEVFGGVMVADPVGLGKTFIALKLMDEYTYKLRQNTLLICPAQLRETMWERELEKYNYRAAIESQEVLGRTSFDPTKYADYEMVIVDESHNFRNPEANRWQNLSLLLSTGKPKKLVLLTATPINNSTLDLYHQIRLFTRDQSNYFAGIGIPDLWQYFLRAEKQPDLLHDLAENVVVKRSREFVRQYFPTAEINGQSIKFPQRQLHAVRYNLQASYEGLYGEVLHVIENLRLAPYVLEFYRHGIPEGIKQWVRGEASLDDGLDFSGVSEQQALLLGRQFGLSNLMRMLYLKRLESSAHALKLSLERAYRFQERFLRELQAGRLLTSKGNREVERLYRAQEEAESQGMETTNLEADLDEIFAKLQPVDASDYDLPTLQAAVEHDVAELKRITERLHPLTSHQDDKLAVFKDLLVQLRGHKVVVFSYFYDTAKYIYKNLQADADFQQRLGHGRMGLVASGVNVETRAGLVRRFAPRASRVNVAPEDELDVLISTDVLSEGQNLQDADVLINYDLHWNPVRMVQRAGRIDRLGSTFDTIHLHNFVPEDALEDLITLVDRLNKRLEKINRAGFLDASVLGETPNPREFNALQRLAQEDGTVLRELESLADLDLGEYLRRELLDYLTRLGGEKLQSMLPFAGASKRAPQPEKRGFYVHLRGGAHHFQLFYNQASGHWHHSRIEALKLARCPSDEPTVAHVLDVYDLVAQAKQEVINTLKRNQLKLPRLDSTQADINRLLRSSAAKTYANLKAMLTYFGEPLPSVQLRKLKRLWSKRSGHTESQLKLLDSFMADNPITRPASPELPDLQESDLEVVCWMALV